MLCKFRFFYREFLCVVAVALSLIASTAWAENARVHFINVDIGDATLIEFPCAAVLIDTSGDWDEKLLPNLEKFFMRRTDLNNTIAMVVLTHAHGDHVGQFVNIARKYKVLNLVYNGRFEGDQRDVMRWLRKHPEIRQYTPEALEIPEDGVTNPTIDPVKCPGIDPSIRVFWGDVDRKPADWRPKKFRDKNSHSVVTKIDFGQGSMLFTGDLVRPAIREMLKRHDPHDFDVDLFKIGHHGYATGTTPELVQAVTPEIAVLSRQPDRPWLLDDYELYTGIISRAREPVTIDVWKRGKETTEQVRETDAEEDRPSKRERKARNRANRELFKRTLTKAIYWTGIDGTIIVDVSDAGVLTVEPLQPTVQQN